MYAKLIEWLKDDTNAWAVTYIAIGIIIYIAFIVDRVLPFNLSHLTTGKEERQCIEPQETKHV